MDNDFHKIQALMLDMAAPLLQLIRSCMEEKEPPRDLTEMLDDALKLLGCLPLSLAGGLQSLTALQPSLQLLPDSGQPGLYQHSG